MPAEEPAGEFQAPLLDQSSAGKACRAQRVLFWDDVARAAVLFFAEEGVSELFSGEVSTSEYFCERLWREVLVLEQEVAGGLCPMAPAQMQKRPAWLSPGFGASLPKQRSQDRPSTPRRRTGVCASRRRGRLRAYL